MFLQLFVLGITKGSIYALLSVSFGVIYFTTRTFHLAHGAVFVLTAYCYYLFTSLLKLPLLLAVLLCFPVAVLLGTLMERFIYMPLRQRYASSTILLLSSLAILITTPPVLAIFFSANPLFFPDFPITSVAIGNMNIPGAQMFMLSSFIFIGLLLLILQRTGIAKLMRAVADREIVAEAIGINVSRVKLTAMAVGSILLVPVSILWGYDTGLIPSMGFNAILIASACAIMGGLGNIFGAALSGIIIGVAMKVGVAFTSSLWAEGIAFLVLVIVLLIRPEGIFQAKTR